MIAYASAGGKAPDSLTLISQDGREQRVMRSDPQVRQRDDKNLPGSPARRHVTHNAGLVAGVEHALDREGTIGAGLYSLTSKDSHNIFRRKRWNRKLVLHLLQ
jgi:hypothetical protein